MHIPSNQAIRSTIGEENTTTTVKCEATSCTSTGVLALLVGLAGGVFIGTQVGSMLMEYKPRGSR